MVNTTPIPEDYMLAVANFCESHRALMVACDNGERENIPALANNLEKDMGVLLKEKERLGYSDGLDFLKDTDYVGFKVKNGRFIGDDVSAYEYGCNCAAMFRKGAYGNIFYELAIYLLYNVDLDKARSRIRNISNKQRGRQRVA